jgi:deoxycytidylate deaminase
MNSQKSHEAGLEDIVVGLVAPIGTDLDPVCRSLTVAFSRLGYASQLVRLTKHLDEVRETFNLDLDYANEAERYDKYMTAGTTFRKAMGRGDALSMVAVGAMRELRKKSTATKHAFILRSLKHPDEVQSLRNIYGPAFVLFSMSSSRTARVKHLANKICKTLKRFDSTEFNKVAERLIYRDQLEQNEPFGQKVSKVFHLADFFIDVDHGMEAAVKRLVELFLGNVFITPTRSEQGMFMAHASAWRSSSLQRQVGAVIATKEGSVIAIGTNEVPKPGGGLYWEGDIPDSRDFKHGGEINDDMKNRMFVEVIQRLLESGMCHLKNSDGSDHELAGAIDPQKIAEWLIDKGHMAGTRIMSVIEFGRCVHAEMAALVDAARRGVAVDDSILFSTTFPCHECARHIVAAGIRTVYFVEPYPKSLVNELYPDSIRIEGEAHGDFVSFVPFVGVAPRRYQDVFKLGEFDRKGFLEYVHGWQTEVAKPRLGEYPSRTQKINILTEEAAFKQFSLDFERITHGDNRT